MSIEGQVVFYNHRELSGMMVLKRMNWCQENEMHAQT